MVYNVEVTKYKGDDSINLELKIPIKLQKILKTFSIDETKAMENTIGGQRYKIKTIVADKISSNLFPLFSKELLDTRVTMLKFQTYSKMMTFIERLKPEFKVLHNMYLDIEKEMKGKIKLGD